MLTRYVYVSKLPHAGFTPSDTDGCVGARIKFTNDSKGGSDNDYFWTFGNNTTSQAWNPARRYFAPGKYTVTMQTTNPSGCRAPNVSRVITIYDSPEAKFSVANACDSSDAVFTDSSKIASGSITSYHWNFGDGDSSLNQNPSHIYDSVGTYYITLTLTSDKGCVTTHIDTIEIHPSPSTAFQVANACLVDEIKFTNTTRYSGSDALDYEWTFGDGNTSTSENPVHIYSQAGNYNVRLLAKNSAGCMDSFQVSAEAYNMPRLTLR